MYTKKHLVTLLTTSDLEGLKRLVYTIKNEIISINSLATDFIIVVNTLDDDYYQKVLDQKFELEVVRTVSNGTPAKGKNSCQQIMLDRDYDYLSQVDADDLLYPTFLLSLEEHLKRVPNIDVLGILPCDLLLNYENDCGHVFKASDTLYGSVWGVSLTSWGCLRGPGKHPEIWEASGSCASQDFHILLSKNACKIMLDEEMITGEDHLQSFKYLGEHQKGNLFYAQTMSSDMYLIDRTFEGSSQKVHKDFDYVSGLQRKIPQYVPVWRSSFGELTSICVDLMINAEEKEEWIKKILKETQPKEKKIGPIIYLPHHKDVEVLDKDMILIDFMSQTQCEDLIAISDKHGGWEPLEGDLHPAQEIRMKEIGEWENLEKHWNENVQPIANKYWTPLHMYGLRDAFTMRYSLDTQVNLTHHCDASLVTGSVKLNDNYEGASLIFPRQNITNDDIPVGKLLLFPGQVTHGHYVDDLTSGVKYSLTMWSKRTKGEY